jgi:hypothetical protein
VAGVTITKMFDSKTKYDEHIKKFQGLLLAMSIHNLAGDKLQSGYLVKVTSRQVGDRSQPDMDWIAHIEFIKGPNTPKSAKEGKLFG